MLNILKMLLDSLWQRFLIIFDQNGTDFTILFIHFLLFIFWTTTIVMLTYSMSLSLGYIDSIVVIIGPVALSATRPDRLTLGPFSFFLILRVG